jgi:hypothetical protein
MLDLPPPEDHLRPHAHPYRHDCLRQQVTDPSCILLYGFKVAFGGGRSTGFAMIYDNLVAAKKYEPKSCHVWCASAGFRGRAGQAGRACRAAQSPLTLFGSVL